MEKLGKITLYNDDCMNVMREFTDKYFDLAIVDPPYGIGAGKMAMGAIIKKWPKKEWDSKTPNKEYFDELIRVSKNQIIFGGNYFTNFLPPSRCWLSWNKGVPVGMSFADFELIWTSFDLVCREIKCRYSGILQNGKRENKIHPTQKPIEIYEWILRNYAKSFHSIIDTHLGSGSSAIASHYGGFEFTGIELDSEYYESAKKRIINHQKQLRLF